MIHRSFCAALLALALGAPALAEDRYEVDPVHACVNFRIKHLGVSYFYGRFNRVEGEFSLDQADPSRCKVEIKISTRSIDTNDPKRDQHMKGPDFFNAEEFPQMTFKSTEWSRKDDDTWTVKGELTLHGVSKEISVDVDFVGEGDRGPQFGYRAGVEAVFTIKRSDFDMTFYLDNGGIGDDVKIWISLEGVRK